MLKTALLIVIEKRKKRMKKNKKRFAEWLALPKKMRQPSTQKELADLLDVCPDTLTRWKADPEVRSRMGRQMGIK
jgi:hypothetical protein